MEEVRTDRDSELPARIQSLEQLERMTFPVGSALLGAELGSVLGWGGVEGWPVFPLETCGLEAGHSTFPWTAERALWHVLQFWQSSPAEQTSSSLQLKWDHSHLAVDQPTPHI